MKWFKHDTDANQDARLQNVLLDYGLEGYGLYWYCIELIAGRVTKENLTFELEHDARIIARNVGSTPQKVEEMMRYFVSQGLFSDCNGVITCLKILRRIDASMSGNTSFRKAIDCAKINLESAISHDSVMNIEDRTEDRRYIRSLPSDKSSEKKSPEKKYRFDDRDMSLAQHMQEQIISINPSFLKKKDLSPWANTIRLCRERDGRTIEQLYRVFNWASNDSFWSQNIQSPEKLRKQFSNLYGRISSEQKTNSRRNQQQVSGDRCGQKSAGDRVREAIYKQQ